MAKGVWQQYSEMLNKHEEDLKKADPATRAIDKGVGFAFIHHRPHNNIFLDIVFGILLYGMVEAGIYGYKTSHWTKADRAMVEGRFDAAIEFIEHSKQKDEKFKFELYKKVYKFATQEAGISDPDDPILLKLYKHGVERRDPIFFRSKGKWTRTFPRSKKKLSIKRNTTRKSRRA
jgi:hypothetical protein